MAGSGDPPEQALAAPDEPDADADPDPVVELLAQRLPEDAAPLLGGGPEGNAHRKALARLVTDLVTTTHRLGKRLRRNLGDNVPDEEWTLAYGQYARAITSLLADERGRVKLIQAVRKAGGAELTEEQFQLELRKLALEAIRDLPQDELDQALKVRKSRMSLPLPRKPPAESGK